MKPGDEVFFVSPFLEDEPGCPWVVGEGKLSQVLEIGLSKECALKTPDGIKWVKRHKVFETEAEALAWCQEKNG